MRGLIRRRRHPFREMVSLRDAMDRFFDEPSPGRGWLVPRHWEEEVLTVDMYQTEDTVVVKTAVPGVKPEDVEITVTGNTLSISGETRAEEEVKEENYLRRERRYGSFAREVSLPSGVLPDEAEASFKDGVLTISVPKAEEAKARTIEVKVRE